MQPTPSAGHPALRARVALVLLGAALLAACAHRPAGLDMAGLAAAAPGWSCLAAWSPRALPGKRSTRYALGRTPEGRRAVAATAEASASLLDHRLRRAPETLGRLRFAWQVPKLIDAADVRQRHGDDAPVRLLLAFDGDHTRLSTRNRALFDLAETLSGERPPFATLMYVWDTPGPVGDTVINNRSDRIRKIVVDAGAAQLGRWREHERDIAADFKSVYGEAPGALIGVALMSDADNTGGQSLAWYGPVCLGPAPAARAP